MSSRTPRRVAALAVTAAAALFAGCDDDAPEPAPGNTTPNVDGTQEPLGSTGGPGETVLNNQPTSPAANNAPPGSAGTG